MSHRLKRRTYHAGVATGVFIAITTVCFQNGSYVTGTFMLATIALLYMGTLGGD